MASAQHPRRRRTAFIGAAALILPLVGSAAWVTVHKSRVSTRSPVGSAAKDGAIQPPRRAAAPTAPARPPAPLRPDLTLTGIGWSAFFGVELPVSPTAGPRHTHGGLVAGFTDSPLGALLAAVNIAVRANPNWGPRIFGPTIRAQVIGSQAAALLASCQDSYAQARQANGLPAGQPWAPAHVTEDAFRWEGYTPADAAVDLVSAGPDGQGGAVLAATRIEVRWRDGDWRVVAPPGGDWGNAAVLIPSLSGYTRLPHPPE